MSEQNGQLTSAKKLSNLVQDIFDVGSVTHAFGYGSGVFSQGRDPGMLDIIFVVRDAQAWHQANQSKNSNHYATWLRCMDQEGLLAAGLQRRFLQGRDAKVFFHVIEDPIPLKYGVIHHDDFLNDLTRWDSLYVAGRLHKPTLPIPLPNGLEDEEESIAQARCANLQSAVAAAMLLSPLSGSSIEWLEFYSRIASLSYAGDFRMQVGAEDPKKIQKLVQTPGQLDRFHNLYRDNEHASILKRMETNGLLSVREVGVEWDPQDIQLRKALIQRLPMSVRTILQEQTNNNMDTGRRGFQQQQQVLTATLKHIVAPAARYQSLKGIFTFGLRNSVRYASAKLAKGVFRKR